MTVKGTLKYRKVERTPQVGKDAGKKKYYATAVQDRTMEFEDFVTQPSTTHLTLEALSTAF